MKTNPLQQEILLMTDTSFAGNQWNRKDETDTAAHLTEKEQLEEACWNGLIQEMLPEIAGQLPGTPDLFIWHVRLSSSFIELEMSVYPVKKDSYFSINPYIFMEVPFYN